MDIAENLKQEIAVLPKNEDVAEPDSVMEPDEGSDTVDEPEISSVAEGMAAGNVQAKKKVRTRASFAKNIVSLALFLIALVLGITASTLYVVRQAMSREYVNQAVGKLTEFFGKNL